MTTSTASELASAMAVGAVAFFAGAGVSIESGLPSVVDIVSRTGERYLPTFWRHADECSAHRGGCSGPPICHFSWLRDIQPEHFYGMLLRVSGNDLDCLGLWASLHDGSRVSSDTGFHPEPNLVHLIIAYYSWKAGVPIFTVNFDMMFEAACERLGIPFRVFDPDDTPPTAITDPAGPVRICKLHGSVQSNSGQYSPQSLRTTMEGITKLSKLWVDYLREVMRELSVVFAGYSGRDVDYYPSMLAAVTAGHARKPYWFGHFESISDVASRETRARAEAFDAHLLPGYPGELLRAPDSPLHHETLLASLGLPSNIIIAQAANEMDEDVWLELRESKDALLDSLAATLPRTNVPEELLWLEILADTGHCAEADEFAGQLLLRQEVIAGYTAAQQLMLLSTATMMSRERAQFRRYRAMALELEKRSKRHGSDALGHLLHARLEVTSSYQMELPNRLAFAPSWTFGDYLLLAWTLWRFHVLDPLFFASQQIKYPSSAHQVRDSSVLAEAKIRKIAIWLGLFEKLRLVADPSAQPASRPRSKLHLLLTRVLLRQEARAQRVGNYRTLVSVYKYLFRLTGDQQWRIRGEDIAALTGDTSALTIFGRDSVAMLEDLDHQREGTLRRAISDAAVNGNRLNEIKCVLSLAQHRMLARRAAGLKLEPLVDDPKRLKSLITEVGADSPRLNRALLGAWNQLAKIEEEFGVG